jgi:ferredoxin-NADP reductase
MTEAIAATARWQSCAIVEVATGTPAIKSFFLRLSETFDYTAGQHVDVRLTAPNGYTAMRSYSIASAPSDSKVIELAIERLADGEVSPFFHDVAQVGDTIELRGPLGGHFLWPGPSNKPVLLIGAGSGVVPLMAMIRYRKASGEPVPVALLLSSRTHKRRSSFLRAFRQVHGYVPAESEAMDRTPIEDTARQPPRPQHRRPPRSDRV